MPNPPPRPPKKANNPKSRTSQTQTSGSGSGSTTNRGTKYDAGRSYGPGSYGSRDSSSDSYGGALSSTRRKQLATGQRTPKARKAPLLL